MDCRSCGTPILPSFKHAIAQNECPACGGQILDEESLALIEDIENTIRGEATVREETAHHLATIIVSKYNIGMGADQSNTAQPSQPVKTSKLAVPPKIAPPSAMKRAEQEQIISPQIPEGISDSEREKICEEAIRAKYNMVDQIQADVVKNGMFDEEQPIQDNAIFPEGAENPILEQERLARLAKQQRAMNGGGGAFRRSS